MRIELQLFRGAAARSKSKPTTATPEPLNDAAQSVRNTALAMGNEWLDKNNEFVERIVSLKWDRVLAIALYIEAFEAGVALKTQPAPVPLAEDEALITRLQETHIGAAARLSLRSGQLAQVFALCDDAESTNQAKECIAGGGVICIQVPEIRAAIEGSK